MFKRLRSFILSLAICGVAAAASQSHALAQAVDLDGRVRVTPEMTAPRQARSMRPAGVAEPMQDERKKLSTTKQYSPEWWKAKEAIEHMDDAQLTRSMTICRNCMKTAPADPTGATRR